MAPLKLPNWPAQTQHTKLRGYQGTIGHTKETHAHGVNRLCRSPRFKSSLFNIRNISMKKSLCSRVVID